MGEATFLLWSTDHRAFWGPERSGYTRRIEDAGRYTTAEAKRIAGENNKRAWSDTDDDVPAEIAIAAPEALDTFETEVTALKAKVTELEAANSELKHTLLTELAIEVSVPGEKP
ncbi:MAG: hypothetical protein ACR2OF_00065 [Hyphomicrobium sp.]